MSSEITNNPALAEQIKSLLAGTTKPAEGKPTVNKKAQEAEGIEMLKKLAQQSPEALAEIVKKADLSSLSQPEKKNDLLSSLFSDDLMERIAKSVKPIKELGEQGLMSLQEALMKELLEEQNSGIEQATQLINKDGWLDKLIAAVSDSTGVLSDLLGTVSKQLPVLYKERKEEVTKLFAKITNFIFQQVKQATSTHPAIALLPFIKEAKNKIPSPSLN